MDNLPQHHIRLLHIEPGLWEDPIRCRLRVVSLQSPRSQPTYEALSYNWGSAEQKSPAVVCDEKSVRLTQNLYDALLHLRHPYQERIMWIDAVCIRQDNLKERAEQVSIMRYIFAQATRVIIWLGTENSEDKMAFSLLEQYKAVITEHGNAPKVGLAHLPYGLPALDKPEWIALAKFFQRPWFQRIWVLQEVVMARTATIFCGSCSAEWDLVSKVAISFRESGRIGPYNEIDIPGLFSTVLMHLLKGAFEHRNVTWTLGGLLRLTRKFLATDPRDKVYALLGVVTDPVGVGIVVDYTLSTEQVYTSVAVCHLEMLRKLEILANAGDGSAQHPSLPSWVPDWSCHTGRSVVASIAEATGMCASGKSQPVLSIDASWRILTVRGMIVDSIAELNAVEDIGARYDLSTEAGRTIHAEKTKASMKSSLALVATASKFPEGQTREESLWRTCCCNVTNDIPIKSAPMEFEIGWRALKKQTEMFQPNGDLAPGFDHTEMEYLYLAQLGNAITRYSAARILCVTAGGYLGNVPRGSKIGDKICVILGSDVPFVLREKGMPECGGADVQPRSTGPELGLSKDANHGREDSTSGTMCEPSYENLGSKTLHHNYEGALFKLIGECYMHGIMHGEAMGTDTEASMRDFEIE